MKNYHYLAKQMGEQWTFIRTSSEKTDFKGEKRDLLQCLTSYQIKAILFTNFRGKPYQHFSNCGSQILVGCYNIKLYVKYIFTICKNVIV